MGLCSDALYCNLAVDLTSVLPTVGHSALFDNNHSIALWPGIGSSEVAAVALLNSILKKNADTKSADADSLALELFLSSNKRCQEYSCDAASIDEKMAIILGEFESILHDSLSPCSDNFDWFNIDYILENLDVGPGASVGASGKSFYHKIANSALSTTNDRLYDLYRSYIRHFDLESSVEKFRCDAWGPCRVVQGSNLNFAPKTSRISRVICTEPLLNMMFQKGLGAGFERVLSNSFGIELDKQPSKNQRLARIGSIDGSYGTIDLSSASDTISIRMIERFFPAKFIRWMKLFRSPFTCLPSGEHVELHMISSMGNAFTFPLQTLIFSCAVKAVYKFLGLQVTYPRDKTLGNFSVFGDDIIVKREAYTTVIELLTQLGFKTNADKSFNEGLFRESCGTDWYQGRNVRGIYAKSLKTPQNCYTLINRLQIWSANQDIPLPNTLRYLMNSVWLLPVPAWDNEDSGVRMPVSFAVRVTFPSGHKLEKEGRPTGLDHNGSIVYMRYLPRPDFVKMTSVGSRPFILSKKRNNRPFRSVPHNHDGILLSALRGSLRNGYLGLKLESARYFRGLAVAPCWDYVDLHQSRFTADGWHRWVTSFEHYTGIPG